MSERLAKDSSTPEETVEWFAKLNRSIPKLLEKDPIPEPDRGVMFTATGDVSPSQSDENAKWFKFLTSSLGLGPAEIVQLQGMKLTHLSHSSPKGPNDDPESVSILKEKGVPQGAATSCGLSILALSHITDPLALCNSAKVEASIVMYADDGLIFLEREEDLDAVLNQFEKAGVHVNESKSG